MQPLLLNCCPGVYLDARCVEHQRPMLEGGTQGSRGHTLVVVPHLTESYEKGTPSSDGVIPLCTLKNFPHRIEHTLQVTCYTTDSALPCKHVPTKRSMTTEDTWSWEKNTWCRCSPKVVLNHVCIQELVALVMIGSKVKRPNSPNQEN